MIFRSRFKILKKNSAFTLIELLLTISLLGILSAIGITMFTGSVDESRYDTTVAEMRQISNALIGDINDKKGGTRSNFGYLGDLGSIPNNGTGLSALVTKPNSAASWNINNTARIGLGWNGPYISSGFSGQDPLKDAWGRDYIYTSGNNASITSYGADGVSGGTGFNKDIVMPIPSNLQTATVYGFLSNGGAPYTSAAQAEINYPNGNGSLATTQANISNGSQGQFQFNNVPLGNRSITIYIPNRGNPTKTLGPIPITVDSSNYLVPTSLTDLNPGGNSNNPNNPNSGSCSSPSNIATISNTPATSFGSQISFSLNASSSATLTKIKVTIPSAATLSSVSIGGSRYRCSRRRQLSPCPVNNGTETTLSPSYNLNSGNNSFQLNFSSSVDSETTATVELTYSNGCDILNLTGLL